MTIQKRLARSNIAMLAIPLITAAVLGVAIGELAPGLRIDLDVVPKKYEGLDGTELAISESQERMAVVVEAKDVETFMRYCLEENIEAVEVADEIIITNHGHIEQMGTPM